MNIEENYKSFEDYKIIRIAQYEADKLTPEAVEILRNEIKIRKLNPELLTAIDTQIEGTTLDDFFEYGKFLINLPCPICGKCDKEIDITRKGRVVSMIVFSGYDKILVCGCKDCLKKEITKTMILSLLIGWWGFPWGPINTIKSLIYNIKKIKETKNNEQSEDFLKFVNYNLGYISSNLENEDKLLELLENINTR